MRFPPVAVWNGTRETWTLCTFGARTTLGGQGRLGGAQAIVREPRVRSAYIRDLDHAWPGRSQCVTQATVVNIGSNDRLPPRDVP